MAGLLGKLTALELENGRLRAVQAEAEGEEKTAAQRATAPAVRERGGGDKPEQQALADCWTVMTQQAGDSGGFDLQPQGRAPLGDDVTAAQVTIVSAPQISVCVSGCPLDDRWRCCCCCYWRRQHRLWTVCRTWWRACASRRPRSRSRPSRSVPCVRGVSHRRSKFPPPCLPCRGPAAAAAAMTG